MARIECVIMGSALLLLQEQGTGLVAVQSALVCQRLKRLSVCRVLVDNEPSFLCLNDCAFRPNCNVQ